MKLALISDLHLLWNNPVCRLDDLTQTQFDKFKFVLDYCRDNDLVLLQAGDFFDAPRSYIFLSKIIDLLNEYNDVDIYAVFGGKSHDTYFYSDETREATNLGILEKTGLITILSDNPVIFHGGIDIYGANFGENIPKVKDKTVFNTLVIHAPITDESNWEREIDGQEFLSENEDYDLILCGDIHKYFVIKNCNLPGSADSDINVYHAFRSRFLINTGPMLRKTVGEVDHEPCFIVFDTDDRSWEKVKIPHKPAEEIISIDHLERKDEIDNILQEFAEQIKEQHIIIVDLLENIRNAIKKNKISDRVADIIAETISRKEDK